MLTRKVLIPDVVSESEVRAHEAYSYNAVGYVQSFSNYFVTKSSRLRHTEWGRDPMVHTFYRGLNRRVVEETGHAYYL